MIQEGSVHNHHHFPPAEGQWHLPNLENGKRYLFQIRALGEGQQSEWTEEAECVPDPVKPASLLSAASDASPWTLLRLIYYGLLHGLTLLRGHLCG